MKEKKKTKTCKNKDACTLGRISKLAEKKV